MASEQCDWVDYATSIHRGNKSLQHPRKWNVHLANKQSKCNQLEKRSWWTSNEAEICQKTLESWAQISRLLHPSRLQILDKKTWDRERKLLQETFDGTISAMICYAGSSIVGAPATSSHPDNDWWSTKTLGLDEKTTASLHQIGWKFTVSRWIQFKFYPEHPPKQTNP